MDRFSILIERQEQLEALIKEWGFPAVVPIEG